MGNKIGWIIAGAIALLIAVAVILKFVFPSPSDPTRATTKRGFMDKAVLTVTPAEVTGRPMTGTGNAADDYAKAIKLYNDNKGKIEMAMDTAAEKELELDSDVVTMLKDIARQVSLGAEKEEMHYTFVYTPTEFKVGWVYEPAQELEQVMQALNLLSAYYEKHDKYKDAANVTEMILIMGWHMVNERSRPYMMQAGVEWQREAAVKLREFYEKLGDTYKSRIPAVREYENQAGSMIAVFREKTAIFKVGDLNELQPGDIFNIAENDQDRAWRVQAILWLGILKFMYAESRGDMRQIDKLIEKYIDSSDPMEAAAAKAAKNLTKAEYDKI